MVQAKHASKPNKPYPKFPLFAASNGSWAKSIRGVRHYFGPWADWEAAEAKYDRQRADLEAGRTPSNGDGLKVRELVNHFLTFKKGQIASNELTHGSFADYYDNCERVIKIFGATREVENLHPLDFEKLRTDFTKTHGPETLKRDIACTRALFNYCDDTFDIRVKWGRNFKKPSLTVLRKHRKARKSRMYTPQEIRRLIASADPQLRAMLYLGLNCGFGNRDCAYLTPDVIDFKRKWINYARNKTGKGRKCPLWTETIDALKHVIKSRPTPSIECDNIFITKYGNLWIGGTKGDKSEDDPISKECTKLLVDLKLKRKGVSFNAMRHIFYTVGKRQDKDATKVIMGHCEKSDDMGVYYDEDDQPVEDGRLLAVAKHVRTWLNSKRTR